MLQSKSNLAGAPAGSHHAALHPVKNLLDLCSRDTSFSHDGDGPWDRFGKECETRNTTQTCFSLLPSLILRQLTTVEATTSFE